MQVYAIKFWINLKLGETNDSLLLSRLPPLNPISMLQSPPLQHPNHLMDYTHLKNSCRTRHFCPYSFLLPVFTMCLSPLQTLTWDKFEEITFYLFFKDILKGVRNGIKQCKYWVGNYFSISPWPALSLPESWGKLTDSNLISWGPQEIQPKTQNPLIPWGGKKKR